VLISVEKPGFRVILSSAPSHVASEAVSAAGAHSGLPDPVLVTAHRLVARIAVSPIMWRRPHYVRERFNL